MAKKYIYTRLKDLREDNDLNQKQIADFLDMAQQQYSNYENGNREMPFHLVIELAKYYNASLDYIAGLSKRKNDIIKEEIKKLKDDEMELLENFNQLSERQKGEIEYHVKQLLEQRSAESEVG